MILEREEGTENIYMRKKHLLVVSRMHPDQGSTHSLGIYPTGNQTHNPPSHTAQGQKKNFLKPVFQYRALVFVFVHSNFTCF